MPPTSEAPTRLLDGRSVLVTGAGQGVGRAHALQLAAAGARIVVNDLGTDVRGEGADTHAADEVVKEIEAAGGTAVPSHDDISTWEGARNAVHTGIEAFGVLDGLVNNAGVLRRAEVADLTEADFDAIVGVHLKGHFGCVKHALEYWRAQHRAGRDPRASVVNTFSEATLVSLPNYAVYGAVKAGIVQLTTVGSREAAAYGVRLNAYAPRALTRMTPGADQVDRSAPHPMDPENSSPLVAWLLSDRSDHVSGQIFQTVGGGVARVTPWVTGEMVWPSDGRFRFEPDEVGPVLDAHVFGSRFPDLALQEPPGFSARLTGS